MHVFCSFTWNYAHKFKFYLSITAYTTHFIITVEKWKKKRQRTIFSLHLKIFIRKWALRPTQKNHAHYVNALDCDHSINTISCITTLHCIVWSAMGEFYPNHSQIWSLSVAHCFVQFTARCRWMCLAHNWQPGECVAGVTYICRQCLPIHISRKIGYMLNELLFS